MPEIRLSEKHGVDPAIPLCYFCHEPKNEVILAGRLRNDREAPRNTVWNMEPCDKCKEYMAKGILLISIRDGEKQPEPGEVPNPYRTGGWLVVKEEAVERLFKATLKDADFEKLFSMAKKKRVCFIHDTVWDKVLNLPRGPVDGVPSR